MDDKVLSYSLLAGGLAWATLYIAGCHLWGVYGVYLTVNF